MKRGLRLGGGEIQKEIQKDGSPPAGLLPKSRLPRRPDESGLLAMTERAFGCVIASEAKQSQTPDIRFGNRPLREG